MSSPFIAEIIMFGGNFAPRGWALCDGQLLPISQNTALFSLLGTTYGGDGRVTFGLPELRGRVPMHPGTGPGLTPRRLGEKGGTQTNTLSQNQMPSHAHSVDPATLKGTANPANSNDPAGKSLGLAPMYNTSTPSVNLHGDSLAGNTANTGGGQAVNNLQPFQAVNFIIALVGIFPSRD